MTEHLTPSDLIYLYLDGETSAVQQTTLFAALATDSDLQEEFNEALSMHKAFEHERTIAQPPSYLTEKVFATNGISQVAATAVGSAATAAFWLWMKRFGAPIASTMLGALVMYFALNWGSGNSASSANTAQVELTPAPLMTSTPASSLNSASFAKEEPLSLPSLAPVHANRHRDGYSPRRVQSTATIANSALQTMQEETTPESEWSGNYRSEEIGLNTSGLYAGGMANSRRMAGIAQPADGMIRPAGNSWVLQANNVFSAALYNAPPGADFAVMKNASLNLLYRFDESYAVGGQVGRKNIALSGFVSDNFVQNPTYTTYGVAFQYVGTEINFLGGEPFAQPSYSFTAEGPMIVSLISGVRYSLGPVWISTGIGYDGFIYSSRGATRMQHSVGLTTAVSMSF